MTTTATNSANGANMTEPHIERFGPDVSIGSLIEAIDRDGVRDGRGRHPPRTAVGPQRRVRRAHRGVGARHAEPHPDADRLHGAQDASGSTACRASRRPSSSSCSTRWPLEIADHYLLPSCLHYLLSTAQLIEILPDETVQHLHRDDTAWIHPPIPTDRDAVPTGRTCRSSRSSCSTRCATSPPRTARPGSSRGATSGRRAASRRSTRSWRRR